MKPTPFVAAPFGTSSIKTSCSPGRTPPLSTSGVNIATGIANSAIGTIGVNNSTYTNTHNYCSGVPFTATSGTGIGVSSNMGVSSSGFGILGGMNNQHVCQSGYGSSNFVHGASITTPNIILPPSPIQTLPPPAIKPILNATVNKSQVYQTFPPIVSTSTAVAGSSYSGIMNPPPSSRGLLPTTIQPISTSIGVGQIAGQTQTVSYDNCMYQYGSTGSQIQAGSQIFQGGSLNYQGGSQIYQSGSRVVVSSGCCS